MKIIYWTIHAREGAAFIIKFWSKPDRSNAITFKTVVCEEEKLRNKIVSLTGLTRFTLKFVKRTELQLEFKTACNGCGLKFKLEDMRGHYCATCRREGK